MITTICKISYGSQTVPPIVTAVQGDTGRAINFEVSDFTPPAGATATYFILKPSGEAIYNSATIADNNILCELTAQSLAETGENRMQVRVLLGEDIVTSFEVILMVRKFLGDNAIESGTEMNIFDKAVAAAAEGFQEQAEQIAENVIESIPEDYTALTEEVTELNERLGDMPQIKDSTETDPDLDVTDSSGNVLVRFQDGHIYTKEFDSEEVIGDVAELKTGITGKIDANQGSENAGKILGIDEDGDVFPTDAPEGGGGNVKVSESNAQGIDIDLTDSFGNVIARFQNGHIRTKNFNSAESASGILFRNKDTIDGIYAACRWHQPNASSKQFCMLIAGDTHTDPTRCDSIIEMFNEIDAFDAGVMLGDIAGNTFADSIAYYEDALEGITVEKPWLTVLGNHDVRNATSDTDLYTKYGDCLQYANLASGESVSGKMYYYKDFASYKIRIIVLMQYDYTYTGELCFGQSQIDWFIATLNSTPSDYGVIIAEHTNPSRYMTYEMDTQFTSDTWRRSNYAPTVMSGDPVPDIVDAWINGTSISQTYNYAYDNPPTALSVSADFTSRGEGEFITYLGGHWHMDVLGYPTSYTNQMDYHVPAAGLSAATQGDLPRKSGTLSEDSFCVLGVDREKKTVKVFHIGAYRTKDAIDRQYFQYTYGGGES